MTIRSLPALSPLTLAVQAFLLVGSLSLNAASYAATAPATPTRNVSWEDIANDHLTTGTGDGFLKAFDAKTGAELWKFQTGSGIVSPPITWEQDGEQYVGVTVGYGGAVPLWGGDMAELTKPVAQGGSFWVFKTPSWDNKVAKK